MGVSESIEPLLEKIEKLSKVVRIAICAGIILILIVPCVILIYYPQYEEIGKLKEELKKVEGERDVAKKKAGKLGKIKKEMKEAEINFNIAKKALPENDQIPLLLTNISHVGQDTGLEFLLFEPSLKVKKKKKKKRKKKGAKEKEKPFYAEIPIKVKVAGNYHNVALFFDKVARLNRIVNIKDIEIVPLKKKAKEATSLKENELIVSCQAITYKFMEVPSEKKDKKKK
ncbi:type 4a pilus biogenesis protein PilO [Desulfobacterales bacterium HSG2]|nr:type 4a pilus biogenesis protein PilO [Desulfobacterales bacterium HSG2]